MPRSVLLVESDKDLAETVNAMLSVLDYPVTVQDNDTRALAVMHGVRFGLLVTTLRRGEEQSLLFAREAKLLIPDLKVMVITGSGPRMGLAGGPFDAVLHKPFDIAALSATVAALTGHAS